MSFIGDLFGGSEQTVVNQARVLPFQAFDLIGDRSTLSSRPKRSNLRLDPRIDRALTQNRASTTSLLNRVRGNQNPFIEARVSPLIERLSGLPAQTQRDFARRNVFGSIANNEVNQLREDVAGEIGNARALATQDALGFERAVLGDQRRGALDLLTKELSALGVSQDAINAVLNTRQVAGGTQTSSGSSTTEGLGNIGRLLLAGSAIL